MRFKAGRKTIDLYMKLFVTFVYSIIIEDSPKMKRILKYLAFILIFVLLILVIAGLVINAKGIPIYENKAPELVVVPDSASIAEGARMASMLCAQCHGSPDGRLGGNHMVDAAEFGEIHAPNITRHPVHGITGYTDGELAYLLRTGIKKNGEYAPPYMVKFPLLSDNDMKNVISFLKSDHIYVQPSENVEPKSKPNLFTKVLTNTVMKPLPYPTVQIPDPDESDPVSLGKYLATAKFDCYSCHSESFVTANPMEPHKSPGFFGGGNPIPDLDGRIMLSANLTMDNETGLGQWSEADFIRTVKLGIRPDGTQVRYPMLPFTLLTEKEISAIWAYLKTIPVISNPKDHTP